MKVARSTVDDALLALMTSITFPPLPTGQTTWVVTSKHWQPWDNTANQPACYVKRVGESYSQQFRGENKYQLHYEIWVYAQFENSSPIADPYDLIVDPIMTAIDNALAPPQDSDWQNLGNPSIANCRLDGRADIGDGSLDGQVCIVLPVSVFIGQ